MLAGGQRGSGQAQQRAAVRGGGRQGGAAGQERTVIGGDGRALGRAQHAQHQLAGQAGTQVAQADQPADHGVGGRRPHRPARQRARARREQGAELRAVVLLEVGEQHHVGAAAAGAGDGRGGLRRNSRDRGRRAGRWPRGAPSAASASSRPPSLSTSALSATATTATVR